MPERSALNLLLVLLAAAPLVLTTVEFVLAQGNQSLRADLSRRQHLISEGAQLARVNQVLIRQIAMEVVKSKNGKLRELLSRNGITIRINPPPAVGNGKSE